MPASATATTPSESMRGLKGKNILVTGGRPSSACAMWKASAQRRSSRRSTSAPATSACYCIGRAHV